MIPRYREDQWNAVAIATGILLVFSIVLGGASRNHALRLALVELASLPVLVLAVSRLLNRESWSTHKFGLGLLAAIFLLPLLQLAPLPPAIWTALPGREQLVLALDLVGQPTGWVPLSLTPDLTWRSFLALLPPVAMFLGVLAATKDTRLRLVHLYLAAAVASVMLGVMQLASGGERLYPWATTAAGNMVGFFANRNHLSTLLLASLPFAAVLAATALRRRAERGGLTQWIGMLFIGLAIVAIGVIRSRAGIVLAVPALALSVLAAWVASGRSRPKPALLAGVGVAAAAVAAVGFFALAPILARFDPNSPPEGRFENWPIVVEAANNYLPVGSGLGSFDPVYRSVEPLERLDSTFFNQAHNEYLELWLETGWLGIGLLAVFLVWWARRSWTCWQRPPSTEADLQRAASVAMLIIMLHSIVDYPMRTETIAVLFALFAALLEGAARPLLERQKVRVRAD